MAYREKKEGLTVASKAKLPPILPFIVAAVLFSVVSILQSLRQGQLFEPATYDDIVYFVDAGRRLQLFYDQGFVALFKGYFSNPPHAPVQSLGAFLGFSLFGFQEWAPTLVNTVWVVALLLVIRRRFAGLPFYVAGAVVVAVLSWPVLGFLVIECRPDVVNALLLAFSCIALVERPWVEAPRSRLIVIALLFAAALMSKPSVFPITIVLYVFSLMVASLIDRIEAGSRLSLKVIATRNLAAIALTTIVVLPHYVVAIRREIDYIITTTFTSEKELWAVKLSFYDHARYYLFGGGGAHTMGVWFFVTAALVALVVIGAIAQKRTGALRRMAGMAAIFGLSYAAVTIPAHKSPFLGIQVTAFCLVFFLLAIRAVFDEIMTLPRYPAAAAVTLSLLCVALGCATFEWHIFSRMGVERMETPELVAKRRALIGAIADATAGNPATGPSTVYFPAVTYYMHPDVLAFEFLRRRDSLDQAFDEHRSSGVEGHLEAIGRASHVVLFAPDDPDVLGWLPSAKSLPAVRAAVEANPDFVRVASIAPPVGGGPVEVYVRKSALPTLQPGQGFLQPEGPYPQWNIPYVVRWTVGDTARLAILDQAPGPAKLTITAQTPVADQVITAFIGDRAVGTCSLPTPFVFATCAFPVTVAAGDKEVVLRFAKQADASEQFHSALVATVALTR